MRWEKGIEQEGKATNRPNPKRHVNVSFGAFLSKLQKVITKNKKYYYP
jgi:hypothetical protein